MDAGSFINLALAGHWLANRHGGLVLTINPEKADQEVVSSGPVAQTLDRAGSPTSDPHP